MTSSIMYGLVHLLWICMKKFHSICFFFLSHILCLSQLVLIRIGHKFNTFGFEKNITAGVLKGGFKCNLIEVERKACVRFHLTFY